MSGLSPPAEPVDPTWSAAFDANTDVVLALDSEGGVVRRRVSPLAGPNVPAPDIDDNRMLARIHPEDVHAALEAWREVAGQERRRVGLEVRMQDIVDPAIWMMVELVLVGVTPQADGVVGLISARFTDGVALDLDAIESDGFSLAAAAPVGLAIYSPGRVIAWANPPFVQMVGREAGPTTHSERRDHPVFGVIEELAENLYASPADSVEPVMVLRKGRTLRVDARQSGGSGDLLISLQDISEQIEESASRVRAEAVFAAAFDHSLAGIAVKTLSGVFTQVNAAFTALLGYEESELLGKSFAMITHPDDLAETKQLRERLLSGEIESFRQEKRYVRRDGETVWVNLSVAMARGAHGQPMQLVTNVIDISDQRRAQAQLRVENLDLTHRAGHDHLTGLPNRRMLEEHIEGLRGQLGEGVFVLVCDVDKFKPVNDVHGHQVGDEVLAEIAQRLRDESRENDLVARVGGDEFVVIAELGDDPERAVHLAERLVEAVRRPIVVGGQTINVGLSIGISRMQAHIDISESIDLADRAALDVKRNGGGALLATI